jgi:hypothetical protein
VRGWRSTLMSCVMIDSVSMPEDMPLSEIAIS